MGKKSQKEYLTFSEERICAICGSPFIATLENARAKTCSKECSRIRKREYNKEYTKRRYMEDPEFRERIIKNSKASQRASL